MFRSKLRSSSKFVRFYAALPSEKIGFIGLGNMGLPMSHNILKHDNTGNYSLVLNDNSSSVWPQIKKEFPLGKYEIVDKPKDIARLSKIIVTMLPDDEIVECVYLGKDGNLSADSLCIDSSTISPMTSKKIATVLKEKKNASFIDAPVSGGVPGAQNATLTFMAGGDQFNVNRASKIITPFMGKHLFHCGEEVGSGLIAKLCNNMLLAICMIGTSEALNMGKKLGLDPKILTDIINESTGRNWCSQTYNPVPGMLSDPQYANIPPNKSYAGGFKVALMCKDLTIGQGIAGKQNIYTPLGGVSHQIYKLLNANKKRPERILHMFTHLSMGNCLVNKNIHRIK